VIVPFRIVDDNFSNLPRARPMLDIMLAVNRITNVVEPLKIDQSLQPMLFGETIDESGTMFEYTADKITCHANVQDAVGTVGQNVNVSTCHTDILQDVDGRDKPGHDEIKWLNG
jgi:hypothetical protein